MVNLNELSDEELLNLYKKNEGIAAAYDVLQQSLKILGNSLFGATANKYFMFFDNRIAEGITKTGQYILRQVAKDLNDYLSIQFGDNDYIIYMATDSIYSNMDYLINKLPKGINEQQIVNAIDRYIKTKIDPVLKESTSRISDKLNFLEDTLSFKREVIASTGFWMKKLKYSLRVLDNEGVRYSEPDIKIVGIETNRSSTPDLVRNWLTEAITSILETKDNDKLIKFIEEKHIEFMNCKIEDIAFPRSANNILKYSDEETVYTAKTPIAVRASILYNTLLEKHGLTNVYQKISEGDKIKFVYLKEPNTLRENIIAFPDKLPPEFNLERYIDKELQFDKVFLDPLKNIVGAIGWQIEESNDLDDFFG